VKPAAEPAQTQSGQRCKHYDDDQLAALVCLIAVINAYNRLNVMLQRARRRLPAWPVGITAPNGHPRQHPLRRVRQ
jgi:hypothetical protein